MDGSSIAPLPPGMVPSDSREDLKDLNISIGNDILPNVSFAFLTVQFRLLSVHRLQLENELMNQRTVLNPLLGSLRMCFMLGKVLLRKLIVAVSNIIFI